MKKLLLLVPLFSVVSVHPYAFVRKAGSDPVRIGIRVYVPGLAVNETGWHEPQPGNQGRNAEWNWRDIESASNGVVKRGDSLKFSVFDYVSPKVAGKPPMIYSGEIASDGLIGFRIEKQGNNYVFVRDADAENEYKSA